MSKTNLHEDQYHNTDLSLAIEKGDFTKVRALYKSNISNNAEILKSIAIKAIQDELLKLFEITPEAELRIYYEAKDQLNLMGEDTSYLFENDNE